MFGIPVHSTPIQVNDSLTETKFVQYRRDRFIEYEEADTPLLREGWAEFRQVPSWTVYRVNQGGKSFLVMHSDVLAAIQKGLPNGQ